MFTETAPAKLNLALHVRARRADGYHELETLFAFATDGDLLTVDPADTWSLQIAGPFAAGLGEDDNLVTRAARSFAGAFDVATNLAVTLEKNLPIASGIGGGSADAAAMLRVLAHIHDIARDDPRLVAVAEQLGSDVPVCLAGVTAIGRGRGEQLVPIAGLAWTPVLLANPLAPVSTATVYAGWDGTDHGALPHGDARQIAQAGRNDLQPPALALAPVIADVLAALASCGSAELVRMSGSGATCFALYADFVARDRVAARLAQEQPDWWLLPTTLA